MLKIAIMYLLVHYLSLSFLLILTQCQDEKAKKSKDILRKIATDADMRYDAFHKSKPTPTYSAFHISDTDADFTYSAFMKNHPEFSNIEKDRTNDILYGQNNYRIRYFRSKRSTMEKSLESIRKRLNEERKKEREEQLIAGDANPRMESNGTARGSMHALAHFEYGKFSFRIRQY